MITLVLFKGLLVTVIESFRQPNVRYSDPHCTFRMDEDETQSGRKEKRERTNSNERTNEKKERKIGKERENDTGRHINR